MCASPRAPPPPSTSADGPPADVTAEPAQVGGVAARGSAVVCANRCGGAPRRAPIARRDVAGRDRASTSSNVGAARRSIPCHTMSVIGARSTGPVAVGDDEHAIAVADRVEDLTRAVTTDGDDLSPGGVIAAAAARAAARAATVGTRRRDERDRDVGTSPPALVGAAGRPCAARRGARSLPRPRVTPASLPSNISGGMRASSASRRTTAVRDRPSPVSSAPSPKTPIGSSSHARERHRRALDDEPHPAFEQDVPSRRRDRLR